MRHTRLFANCRAGGPRGDRPREGPGGSDRSASSTRIPRRRPTWPSLPGMTPAIARALVAARPFESIVTLHAFLLGQKLTQDQASAIYAKASQSTST